MACRRRIACLLVTATVLALAASAPAGAQQAPTLGAPEQTTSAPAITTTTAGDSGLKGWQEALIVAAGLILLAGIAWAIIGDARQRAPVVDRRTRDLETAAAGGGKLSPHERRRRKERARAKARAARASRKRNR